MKPSFTRTILFIAALSVVWIPGKRPYETMCGWTEPPYKKIASTCGKVDIMKFDKLRKQRVFVVQTGLSWGCILCVQGALKSAIRLCNFEYFRVIWAKPGTAQHQTLLIFTAKLGPGVQRVPVRCQHRTGHQSHSRGSSVFNQPTFFSSVVLEGKECWGCGFFFFFA